MSAVETPNSPAGNVATPPSRPPAPPPTAPSMRRRERSWGRGPRRSQGPAGRPLWAASHQSLSAHRRGHVAATKVHGVQEWETSVGTGTGAGMGTGPGRVQARGLAQAGDIGRPPERCRGGQRDRTAVSAPTRCTRRASPGTRTAAGGGSRQRGFVLKCLPHRSFHCGSRRKERRKEGT